MTCQHFWVVPTPNGTGKLPSYCRRCGAERDFPTDPELLTRTKRGHTGIDLKRGAP